MNPYKLSFQLNPKTQIVADFNDPLCYIGWGYDFKPIVLIHNNTSIPLVSGPSSFNIRDLRDLLKKALNNELILHKSITSDIGYLCNKYHKSDKGFLTEHIGSNIYRWIGYKYFLWEEYENRKRYMTWLYNDQNGNIILEVTPSYPFSYLSKKERAHYIPYKKWMLRYKPYLIATLSRETAQQWLEQAEYFVKTIEENTEQWEKEAELEKTLKLKVQK